MSLGIVFAVACYVSTKQRDQYLYAEGSKVAAQFLQVVGQNKLLEAYELTRSEPERQVAGTSLEEAYKNKNHLEKENVNGLPETRSRDDGCFACGLGSMEVA